MQAGARTIDEYLAALSNEKRATLEKLRRDIRAAAPMAEKCISYQVPGFRLDGRLLVSFGAAKDHCVFCPGTHPIEAEDRPANPPSEPAANNTGHPLRSGR